MNHALAFGASLALIGACTSDAPSELILVVDSDMQVPDALDAIRIVVDGSAGTLQDIRVDLTREETPELPLTLALFAKTAPAATTATVRVVGSLQETEQVERIAQATFVPGRSLMLPISLRASCLDVSCAASNRTCVAGECRSIRIPSELLLEWSGRPARIEDGLCEPTEEICNTLDDDCDAQADNGFDLESDPNNCGRCGLSCAGFPCIAGQCAGGNVRRLVAGATHSCALLRSGRVFCWGNNDMGQLGDGSTMASAEPTAVEGISDAITLASGPHATCAVTQAGQVRCWGRNIITGEADSSPIEVAGLTGAADVAVGSEHACAVLQSGGVSCWGQNAAGQLGDGTMTARDTPSPVQGLSDAFEVAAGTNYTCAIRAQTNQVACWGANDGGKLGNGSTDPSSVPVAAGALFDVAELALGGTHSCARRFNGEVFCWGQNDAGQLGLSDNDPRPRPTPVPNLAQVQSLSASPSSHTCVMTISGQARCWGTNAAGQLGDNSTEAKNQPTDVTGFSQGSHVATGGAGGDRGVSCAVTSDNAVFCWGALPSQGDQPAPVRIADLIE